MADYPSIRTPAYPLEEETVKLQVKTPFESGAVQSRAQYTTHKMRWTLNYPAMTVADYNTLRIFFYTNIGSTFNWTYPTMAGHELSGTTIEVRFVEGSLKARWINKRYWTISVQLEEK